MKVHLKLNGKRRLLVLIASLMCILFYPICVTAATSTSSILSQFPLESNSIFSNVMRSIGWSMITGLHWLVSGLETSIYSINDAIGGFFTSDAVLQLEQKVFPLALALLVLVILYIGILSMFKPPNFSNIVGNFTIGIIVFISLPYLLSTAYSFTTQAISYINGDSNSLQLMSDKILVDNITDTTRYDAEGFKSTTLKNKSYFAVSGADTSKIANIDINELVDPDKMKKPDVWKNKLVTNQDGSTSLQELDSGKYGLISIPALSHYYYRWNVDWFTILITLVVTAAALLLSGIKIARLIYELAINQLMAQVMALLDIVTAQRLKKCIQLLISTLGTLFAVFLMLQMYILGTSYVSAQTNINIFVRLLLMLALAFAVIDGPNLFEQIFGVDAGIRSGMRSLYGLKAAGSLVSGGVALAGGKSALDALRSKGILGAAKSVIRGTGSAAGGIGGVAAGVARGAADNRRRVSAVQQGFASAAEDMAGSVAGAASAASAGSVGGNSSAGASNQAARGTARDSGASVGNNGHANMSSNEAAEGTPRAAAAPASGGPGEHGVEGVQNDGGTPADQRPSYDVKTDSASVNPESEKATGNVQQPAKKSVQSEPASIGDYIRSKASAGFQQSKPTIRTRRVYGLTRGSMEKHGDKLVDRETRAQTLMQSNTNLTHRQAVREAKRDLRNERADDSLQGAEKK